MAQLDTRIPMMGANPNFLATAGQAAQTAGAVNELKQQNALRGVYAQHGAGIAQGDQNALNALAGVDPMQALGVQNTMNDNRRADEQLQLARASGRREAERLALDLSEVERNRELDALNRGLAGASQLKGPDQWDAYMQEHDLPELVGRWNERDVMIARALGIKDAWEGLRGRERKTDLPEGYYLNDPRDPAAGASRVPGLPDDQSDPSAAEEKIARVMEVTDPRTGQPFTRQRAIEVIELYDVSRDPVTGEAQLVNRATGTPVGQRPQQPPRTVPAPDSKTPGSVGDVANSLGAEGIARNLINRTGDFFGAGLAFPEAEEARAELTNLSTQTMLALSGEWPGRPSNLTREKIEELTVKPGEFFTGKDSALIKLRDMRDLLGRSIISAGDVSEGQFTPQQKADARAKMGLLGDLYDTYTAMIGNLEGGAQSNTTSGGVNWRVVE